ncbi:hypothetical protein [Sphingomonas bacterium]|uniref:hypothetical protein n=1 Tax=Sphingomonas bacterium TaxID=1895847 RepID=UPI002608D82F|nr:hypothetical protein [Sphingomonas bacterium]MDB5678616.1 hypothetical protein [Sphingomonas bacterium]
MQNRTPVARAERPALPDFTPVPRQGNRHDGWTPARQRAFIEALADTGCVTRAAAMVNMAQANCYTLRRAPGAEEFRRAWEAALDFGLGRLKDIVFERAIEGELIPVFAAGKLMGFRRKRNDALLMFCLRHYGQDANGKRTTINYFSTRASAGSGDAGAGAEASTTTVRTVINGDGNGAGGADSAAAAIEGFAGVTLDAEAQAAIGAALAACAERQRAIDDAYERGGNTAADALEDDPETNYIRLPENGDPYRGELLITDAPDDEDDFIEDEPHWSEIGEEEVAGPLKLDGGTAPPDD